MHHYIIEAYALDTKLDTPASASRADLMAPGSVQMGERNVAAARNALRAAAIPLVSEAVGGAAGRSVRFHVSDGRVEIRTAGSNGRLI